MSKFTEHQKKRHLMAKAIVESGVLYSLPMNKLQELVDIIAFGDKKEIDPKGKAFNSLEELSEWMEEQYISTIFPKK